MFARADAFEVAGNITRFVTIGRSPEPAGAGRDVAHRHASTGSASRSAHNLLVACGCGLAATGGLLVACVAVAEACASVAATLARFA